MRMPKFNSKGSKKGQPNHMVWPVEDKIHHYPHSVKKKIMIVQQAYESECRICPMARKHRVDPTSVCQWKLNLAKLQAKALVNLNAKTSHMGMVVVDHVLESQIKTWILQQRLQDLIMRTCDIINHAIFLHPHFKSGTKKILSRWVYNYLGRMGLSIRRVTRVGQKLSGHLEQVRTDSAAAVSSRFLPGGTLAGMDDKYFINMDQMAVYYESKSKTMISVISAGSVPACDSGSNSKRCTVILAVAADGTKLPPFVVFKGT